MSRGPGYKPRTPHQFQRLSPNQSRNIEFVCKDTIVLAGPPENDVLVPDSVVRYAAGRPLSAIWMNEFGGLTFRLTETDEVIFIKWAPTNRGTELDAERIRLNWAFSYTPVPKVIDFGEDDEGSWLVTEGIDAENTVSDRWKLEPALAVTAIGRGLRAMHDALPVDSCPFVWSTEDRVSIAKGRAMRGDTQPANWHEEFHDLSIEAALAELDSPPSIEQLVVCHGDACAPNTLIDKNGEWVGHVDLGRLGTADRWADISIAAWSTQWNYGPGLENLLYDSYGINPDPEKIRFYRLLWDLDE